MLPVSVLVVADEERFARVEPLLVSPRDRRLEVTRVEDPTEALEALQALLHDVCVVLKAPGEATEWVRCAREAGAVVPVVVLGEGADTELDQAVSELGASEYLPLEGLTPEAFLLVVRHARKYAQAWEALRQAIRENAQLNAALAALPLGVAVTDPKLPDDPIIFVNPAFERITGYGAPEALGRNWRFLEGASTDPTVMQELREAVAEQRPATRRVLHYRRDGTPFWSEVRFTPVRDADGQVGHVVGLLKDVTADRERETRLGRNERCVSRLVEQLEEPAAIFQEDVLVQANAALAQLLGAEAPERVAGRSLAELAGDVGVVGWRAAHASAPPCGTPVRRRVDLPVGGRATPVEVESSLVSYQGGPAVLDVLRPVGPDRR